MCHYSHSTDQKGKTRHSKGLLWSWSKLGADLDLEGGVSLCGWSLDPDFIQLQNCVSGLMNSPGSHSARHAGEVWWQLLH